ncbi:hypothetical protein AK812_SmicGene15069 [Symbiodinium microadriaticum]|uniref:Uncharacterized protein n=1 Tax=Symbiodinium microadriaticum TaxID=2951 RepID=A0A1Q9E3X2_SYMMI|nr:hypothetical protein AK812_SmicGene15069 [Symbiodinium microadriaticum]
MQVGRASEKTGWKCLVVESKAAQAYLQEHDRLRSTCAPSHLDAARILTRFGFLTLYRDSTVQDPRAPGLGHPPVSQKRGSWLWEHPSSHARHTQHELLGVLPARSGWDGCAASFATWAWTSLKTYPVRSGSYIHDGAPSTFHDWEFRTSMRLKLYEDAIRAKTKTTTKGDKTIDPDDSDELTAPGGLRDFISRMSNVMFPRAAEEARELFRAGQRQGALARQGGESMLSHVSRRRRWWKLLKSLDDSIELSEPMRVELVFELSGLNRQESLVIKACTSNAKSFEAVSATLVEHYSGVHLKAQFAYDDAYPQEDEEAEEYDEEEDPSYEDFELDEDEALALNCLEELDPEEAESGHAIQLQLAANAAFGKAKGRKGKGRGKGKGKGKVVRSHLTLDERRDNMKALKAKSKCLRCGAIGHWAGDPACKFPNQNGGKHQGKNRTNIAIVAPRQDPDGGLHVPSGNDEDLCNHMVNELRSKAAPAQVGASAAKPGCSP